MTVLIAPLFLCCVLSINTVCSQQFASNCNNDASFCCNSQSRPTVTPSIISVEEVVNNSPNYLQVGIDNVFMKDLDNVCWTYFPLGHGAYLQLTGLVYSNGSYVVIKFIIQDLFPNAGIGRLQGLALVNGPQSVVFDEVHLGDVCPGVRVYYRNYIAGDCTILNQAIGEQTDYRHGDSTTRDISDDCKRRIVELGNCQQFRGSNFVYLPNRLNRHCVTHMNGASCINADRVLPQDSYTLSTCPT